MNIGELAVENLDCPRCGVAAGEPCRTGRGLPTTYPHVGRFYPASAIYAAGYEVGRQDEARTPSVRVSWERS